MKAVSDSSSIFEAILQGKIHILSEGVTIPLAYYELGNCSEEALKISIKLELTFYDSAYVNLAKTKNIPLITEDGKLRRKAEKIVENTQCKRIITHIHNR